jgi:hypothetical protein
VREAWKGIPKTLYLQSAENVTRDALEENRTFAKNPYRFYLPCKV